MGSANGHVPCNFKIAASNIYPPQMCTRLLASPALVLYIVIFCVERLQGIHMQIPYITELWRVYEAKDESQFYHLSQKKKKKNRMKIKKKR